MRHTVKVVTDSHASHVIHTLPTEGKRKFSEFSYGFHSYLIDLIKEIDEYILLVKMKV